MKTNKDIARYIINHRQLRHGIYELEEEYISIQFYYVYNGVKYYVWVDYNLKEHFFDWQQYIFVLDNSRDVIQKALQEELDQELDFIYCNIEKYLENHNIQEL